MKVGTGWLYRHLRGVKSSFVKIDFVFQPGFQAGKKIGPSFCIAPEPVNAGFIINPAFSVIETIVPDGFGKRFISTNVSEPSISFQ